MVFANRVGKKIREVHNLPYVITVVDGNEDYSDETDVCEDPNDRGNNSYKEKNDRTDNAVEKVEVEYENYNDIRDNTRTADNDEGAMLEKL